VTQLHAQIDVSSIKANPRGSILTIARKVNPHVLKWLKMRSPDDAINIIEMDDIRAGLVKQVITMNQSLMR